ncbi:MAG: hypothetical protein EP349_08220 [Alphaproteobacteria bacterium]|nr:MAG: hypothetical protein EP349_08220 [Alphaproteobacteria bacterium]
MTDLSAASQRSRISVDIRLLVFFSGLAALSWEVVWQIKSTLALGVSAWGTALTLATTMGGMSLGALLTGHILKNKNRLRPVRLYGILEILIGLSGLLLPAAFQIIDRFDIWVYATHPDYAALVHILSIAAALGIPTFCLGATLPVIGLVAQQHKMSLALLYGLNTLGAACGVLAAAFLLIPLLGVSGTIAAVAAVNITVGFTAIFVTDAGVFEQKKHRQKKQGATVATVTWTAALMTAFVTGFATFALEVAWFRSLTSAFLSTTDAFAMMLAAVLVALGAGARLVGFLKKRQYNLGAILSCAAILILLATPLVERFDRLNFFSTIPVMMILNWFFMSLYVVGVPMLFLGVALPWLLDEQKNPKRWGGIYSLNAFAAVLGSVTAAWVLLPAFGFARTAWLIGALVLLTGLPLLPRARRAVFLAAGITALLVAVVFESGIGRTRVQGWPEQKGLTGEILAFHEGPDATISAMDYGDGRRILIINGFLTTSESSSDNWIDSLHYMPWMGHLPMLMHPDPKKALVICFGTGQTAHAVRLEKPETLNIVDLNKAVLKMAPIFTTNQNVLQDPIVKTTVMDGRAYLRRTQEKYDVITLEPMPPNFAGTGALYSREFYQAAREKMTENGIIAQWMPFHLMSDFSSASIAAALQSVFPNAVLWLDPPSTTGILIGSVNEDIDLTKNLPGYDRAEIARDMSAEDVRKAFILDRKAVEAYSRFGQIVSDDNQILSYGKEILATRRGDYFNTQENFQLLEKITNRPLLSPTSEN